MSQLSDTQAALSVIQQPVLSQPNSYDEHEYRSTDTRKMCSVRTPDSGLQLVIEELSVEKNTNLVSVSNNFE